MRSILIVLSALFAFNTFSQEIKELTILHWNDFHARNQPYKVSKKESTGEQVYYEVGGTGNMFGYLNKYRTSNSLVLNAGDDFQGTPVSNFTRGKSQIELLNMFRPDALVLGNHEFDYSRYSLDTALKLAKFDVLSANVFMSAENSLMTKPFVIKEVNGIKIGIIGITLPELFETSLPANVSGLVMLNTDSVISAGVRELKAQNTDLIVILSHSGIETDREIAAKHFADVDIIVGGHSHSTLFKPVVVNGVAIVQAGSYGRNLGKLDLKVDTEKDTVISFSGMLIETVTDPEIQDKTAQKTADDMIAGYLPELSMVIGKLETDWRASYSEECNLGQFEADAFRIKTGADIGFVNGGGLRKSLLKGDILVGDIWEINPFGNEVQIITVTGKELRQMIKNNIKIRHEKQKSNERAEILQTSGLSYSYDSRLIDSQTDEYLLSFNSGRANIEDDANYTIATNNYVISQFNKFFGEIDRELVPKITGWLDRDLIIEAVRDAGVINTVLEKRIVDAANE